LGSGDKSPPLLLISSPSRAQMLVRTGLEAFARVPPEDVERVRSTCFEALAGAIYFDAGR